LELIGLLGGTFNPIHFGHLRMAQELADALSLAEIRFIPAANPPHKAVPTVSAQQRAEMVQLAIADNPLFRLDKRELQRQGASYTIDTLISLRAELGSAVSLVLCMGSDAFRKLDTWHRWQELLDYCHIALVQRPLSSSETLPKVLETFLFNHYSEHSEDLHDSHSGRIIMQQITALDISSTAICHQLKLGQSVRYLLPEKVIAYLQEHALYQSNLKKEPDG
jgi:nicotinate-nucleotide adenylyltransferase